MSGSSYLIHNWLSCHRSEPRLDKKRLNLYFSFLFRGILSIQLRDGVTVQLGRACYNKINERHEVKTTRCTEIKVANQSVCTELLSFILSLRPAINAFPI